MSWAVVYGIASLVACAVAWASGDHARQKVAMVFFGSWAITQFIHAEFTPPWLLAINAGMDLIGLMVVLHTKWCRKGQSFAIVLLYLTMLSAHFATLLARPSDFNPYYILLNVLFVAQVLIITGGGIRDIGAALVHYLSRYRSVDSRALFHRENK